MLLKPGHQAAYLPQRPPLGGRSGSYPPWKIHRSPGRCDSKEEENVSARRQPSDLFPEPAGTPNPQRNGPSQPRAAHGRRSPPTAAGLIPVPLGPDQSCLSRKTQAKAELRNKALKGRSTPPVPGVAKPEVILSFPHESGGTLRVTGSGFQRHDGKCSFSSCSTCPKSQLARKCTNETSEAIFVLSRTQAIFFAGFRISKISLLPYTEASEISMISPDRNSLNPVV